MGRARRDPGLSSLAPVGGKIRDPGSEVEVVKVELSDILKSIHLNWNVSR